MSNKIFIATSLDGYIADVQGNVDWLDTIENPDNTDMGFDVFMATVDALVMGRNTLEKVLSFDCDWPYSKPVFVLTNTLTQVPKEVEGKVSLISGDLSQVVKNLNEQGFINLYIDGGKTIQSFLQAGLIDEMIITLIPILLGQGTPLFSQLDKRLAYRGTEATCFSHGLIQTHYTRDS